MKACEICLQPATVHRPATRKSGKRSGFEEAFYCDHDAERSLGWGDTFHPITECAAKHGEVPA